MGHVVAQRPCLNSTTRKAIGSADAWADEATQTTNRATTAKRIRAECLVGGDGLEPPTLSV
jgi:hypothetical protein